MTAAGIDKTIDKNLGFAEGIMNKFVKPSFEINKQKLGKDLGMRSPGRLETT